MFLRGLLPTWKLDRPAELGWFNRPGMPALVILASSAVNLGMEVLRRIAGLPMDPPPDWFYLGMVLLFGAAPFILYAFVLLLAALEGDDLGTLFRMHPLQAFCCDAFTSWNYGAAFFALMVSETDVRDDATQYGGSAPSQASQSSSSHPM